MSGILNGRTVIVTGGGAGLGKAYALALAAAGASVVVNDVVAESARETVELITADGGRAVDVIAPVGDSETAQRLIDTALAEFGGMDAIITNAGFLRDRSILKMTDDDFDDVLRVHVRGTITCARAAYASFKERGVAGRIIAVGSPTGQRGNFGQTNYAAAKAAIVGMVRTWSLEMSRSGVMVNAIIPVAATAMTRTIPYFAAAVEAEDAGLPLPGFFRHDLGFGTPDDVSALVVFLASEESAGVTGQAIGIGGDRLQLWSHPEPVLSEYRADGWSVDDLTSFAETLRSRAQSVGEDFPPLPADLQRTIG